MTEFRFEAVGPPFPKWLGPFSPSRGRYSGFRVLGGRLGTYVNDESGFNFWHARESTGVAALAGLVSRHWGGGRILLLANGLIIKPLQSADEVGQRVVAGIFAGPVILVKPDGGLFDMSSPRSLQPGDEWTGPGTTGLECVIKSDGSMSCHWYHPTETGRIQVSSLIHNPDSDLASGFRKSRGGAMGGRVRVTANGLVITNDSVTFGGWTRRYVGRISTDNWPIEDEWIREAEE
jgi:hypothetical protein